jgi:hypothetical protein
MEAVIMHWNNYTTEMMKDRERELSKKIKIKRAYYQGRKSQPNIFSLVPIRVKNRLDHLANGFTQMKSHITDLELFTNTSDHPCPTDPCLD